MARVEVPMPQMGESIAEGTVSVWLKKVGERVERDEPIMEISTDKVDAEIPSPAAGVLSEIVVREGETVEVGTVVAYVETEAIATHAVGRDPVPLGGPALPAPSGANGSSDGTGTGGGEVLRNSESADKGLGEDADTDGGETAEGRLRRRSTPLVRRIAAEHGVGLEEVPGTGRAGRVTKDDVLQFVERLRTAGTPARAGRGQPRPAGEGSDAWETFYSEVRHPEVGAMPGDRVEKMSRMTSLIAENMVLSKRISPHVHSYFEIDYSRIDQLRAANRKAWSEQGVKVTYTTFVAHAVARALREQPRINAAISGENVIYRAQVNLGIAVALDWGLIVPVLRKADELSLVGLARAIADLADRARRKRLSPEEVQGGTFTITNPGVFGTVLGFPIVNQPQVAILCMGGVEKRPVVISDEYGGDAIVARNRGFISLGFDHRLVNGADGDRFLARVKALLENPPEPA